MGLLAERAVCFACVNFFFNDFSEPNYLRIYLTDFRDLYTVYESALEATCCHRHIGNKYGGEKI